MYSCIGEKEEGTQMKGAAAAAAIQSRAVVVDGDVFMCKKKAPLSYIVRYLLSFSVRSQVEKLIEDNPKKVHTKPNEIQSQNESTTSQNHMFAAAHRGKSSLSPQPGHNKRVSVQQKPYVQEARGGHARQQRLTRGVGG